jgi:hypothetical protein
MLCQCGLACGSVLRLVLVPVFAQYGSGGLVVGAGGCSGTQAFHLFGYEWCGLVKWGAPGEDVDGVGGRRVRVGKL